MSEFNASTWEWLVRKVVAWLLKPGHNPVPIFSVFNTDRLVLTAE